ncbi:hypothetical protein [Paracoccus sp. T5]|uniref:hypothetical protein n=1 Tax=Paracoccus sp. T5 TaxID=3402161 RepID=UPI003AE2936A
MTFNGIFVEDNDTEAVYAEQMSSRGKLCLKHERPRPVSKHSKDIFAKHPDILVLDFRLDLDLGDMEPNEAYKGSAMAQQLRDLAISEPQHDFPIVLVSSEQKIREQFVPDRTSHDLFDMVCPKEEVQNNRAIVRQRLIGLCVGYKRLRESAGAFNLSELAQISDDEDYAIDFQDLRQAMARAGAPHLVSALFLNNLIGRSGPLIGIEDACARLGVDKGAAPAVSKILQERELAYNGLFSEGWTRFWAHRLDDFSRSVFGGKATGIPSGERAKRISEAFNCELPPAKSPWTGEANELIAFACACCGRGTEIRHSVGVFEMGMTTYSSRRRICWLCIHDDSYLASIPPFEIDEADAAVVEEVKKSQLPG